MRIATTKYKKGFPAQKKRGSARDFAALLLMVARALNLVVVCYCHGFSSSTEEVCIANPNFYI
jgi:hypothetical protein